MMKKRNSVQKTPKKPKKHQSEDVDGDCSIGIGSLDFFRKRISVNYSKNVGIDLVQSTVPVKGEQFKASDYLTMNLKSRIKNKNKKSNPDVKKLRTKGSGFFAGPSNKLRKETRSIMLRFSSWRFFPISLCLEMHRNWSHYAFNQKIYQDNISGNSTQKQASILKMDFLGANLGVISSLSVRNANLRGFVVSETRNTFYLANPESLITNQISAMHITDSTLSHDLIERKDELCRVFAIPKQGTIFEIILPKVLSNFNLNDTGINGTQDSTAERIILLGNQLIHRPIDRALRKWKSTGFGTLSQPKSGSARRNNACRPTALAQRASVFYRTKKLAIHYPLDAKILLNNFN